MVGVVLVVVRKGHKAPFEVVHQDVTESIPLGEAVLSPDARLFLRQRLNQLLLPVELDGGHRHGNHVFIAHIAVIPLLQPGKDGQIQSQRLFIVQVEIGDLSLDRCYLMGVFIGKVNMDRNAPDYLMEDTGKALEETEDLILRAKEELQHVRYIATPRFVPSTTEKMMVGIGKLCEKYNLPVQSHLSENRNEIAWVKELHPKINSYTEVYDYYGLLRKNQTIMAHAIYLGEKEKELLREKQVFLAHCAHSNANLSSGVMSLRKNLESGLNCVIASDVAGGHTPAMNQNAVMSVEISKINALFHEDEPALSLPEAFYLATKGAGTFWGKVGSFESGYEFDALVIDMDEMGDLFVRTVTEKLEQFFYDGDDRNIIDRYCQGKQLPKPFPEVERVKKG